MTARGTRPTLALEDARSFTAGRWAGRARRRARCVQHRALGYQEVLTDPSYAGQIVTMTYPHIGNYGVNREDVESAQPQVAGSWCARSRRARSSWRASASCTATSTRRDRRHQRGRHARAHAPPAHARRQARRHLHARPPTRDASSARRASRNMVGSTSRREVTCAERLTVASRAGASATALQGRGLRLRDEAQHRRMLAAAGCDVTVVPRTTVRARPCR
jgi:carbamoyl-phosphate synthase small subunit